MPPATVAEWTLEADGNRDFYDGKCLQLKIDSIFTDVKLSSSLTRRWLQLAYANREQRWVSCC